MIKLELRISCRFDLAGLFVREEDNSLSLLSEGVYTGWKLVKVWTPNRERTKTSST